MFALKHPLSIKIVCVISLCIIISFTSSLPYASANNNPPETNPHLLEMTQIAQLEEEFALLRLEQTVSIASKIEEKASKAPSIVTVITAEEIENIGARTLTEILRIVPGFDIIKEGDFGDIVLGVRGVRDSGNRIKVYIDGHSINLPYDGKTSFFFDDLSLKNVKRIEIIRGPGSSLYGANAFLAVINIILLQSPPLI